MLFWRRLLLIYEAILTVPQVRLEALPDQHAEIERLRAVLDTEGKVCVAAEQQAAVLAAKLDAAIDRATREESRVEQAEKQAQVTARDLVSANAAIQAGQARLESAAREIEDAKKAAADARAAAKKSEEEAAELRGRKAVVKSPKE